jgi:hypothetical protein
MLTRLSVVAFLKSCAQYCVGAGHRHLVDASAREDARFLIAPVDQLPQERSREGLSKVAVEDAKRIHLERRIHFLRGKVRRRIDRAAIEARRIGEPQFGHRRLREGARRQEHDRRK